MTDRIERSTLRERGRAYVRFIKIEHTLFSLPVLLAGAILAARGLPDWRTLVLVLLAGTGARTLAMSLNRLIDKNIDRKNPRTAGRELPAGILSVWDAILVSLAGLAVYLWAAQALNDFCLRWSWLPVVLFILYPTLKRFTWLCHFGLGLAWALAPLGGWFAVRPGFAGSWPAWFLAAFSFFWLAGFDIIYATLDEEFDRQERLYSLPARWGRSRALQASGLLHLAAFLCLAGLYLTSLNGVGAAFCMIVAGFLLFLEHIVVDSVDLAFFKINIVAGFVVLGMVALGVGSEF